MSNDVQRLADKVDCELCWGTDPVELVRGINASLRVQDVVSVLSRCGMNATATRLFEAHEARKGATK